MTIDEHMRAAESYAREANARMRGDGDAVRRITSEPGDPMIAAQLATAHATIAAGMVARRATTFDGALLVTTPGGDPVHVVSE